MSEPATSWPRVTDDHPLSPVDAIGAPREAAQLLQEATAALTPLQRERLATRGHGGFGGFLAAVSERLNIGFIGNEIQVVNGSTTQLPPPPGEVDRSDAAIFAAHVRRMPGDKAEALHKEFEAAARRARYAGEAGFAEALDAVAGLIKAAWLAGGHSTEAIQRESV